MSIKYTFLKLHDGVLQKDKCKFKCEKLIRCEKLECFLFYILARWNTDRCNLQNKRSLKSTVTRKGGRRSPESSVHCLLSQHAEHGLGLQCAALGLPASSPPPCSGPSTCGGGGAGSEGAVMALFLAVSWLQWVFLGFCSCYLLHKLVQHCLSQGLFSICKVLLLTVPNTKCHVWGILHFI